MNKLDAEKSSAQNSISRSSNVVICTAEHTDVDAVLCFNVSFGDLGAQRFLMYRLDRSVSLDSFKNLDLWIGNIRGDVAKLFASKQIIKQ